MSKKIILHIGFGKTGTSSIQGMLFNNRDKLKKHGFYYPETGVLGTAHHQLADFKATNMSEDILGLYDTVLDEFSRNKCKVLLLSSEYFCFCRPNYVGQIANILNGWDVEILFYVRRQVDLIPSTFMQKVKTGDGGLSNWDIKCFLNKNKKAFDFNIRIESWVSAFGQSSIKVRLYGEPKDSYDVCSDFITAIDFDGELAAPSSRVNSSLLPEFIDLVKLIYTSDCTAEFRGAAIENLVDASKVLKTSSNKQIFDDELTTTIYEYYKNSNKQFAEKYMRNKFSGL